MYFNLILHYRIRTESITEYLITVYYNVKILLEMTVIEKK